MTTTILRTQCVWDDLLLLVDEKWRQPMPQKQATTTRETSWVTTNDTKLQILSPSHTNTFSNNNTRNIVGDDKRHQTANPFSFTHKYV
jgi:hypothetical protein